MLPPDRHVRRSGDDYAKALLALLPQGQAWTRDPESILVKTVNGLAAFWGFVDGRIADLLEIESDPTKTTDSPSYGPYRGLLPEWERAWGLPDECFPDTLTEDERREMLRIKMTMLGGQSREFFYQLADWAGFVLHIEEFAPFMVGVSHVGDTRTPPLDPDPLKGQYRWYIGPPEMRFYWTVKSDAAVLQWFRCGKGGGQCGIDPHLRVITNSPLECLLNRWKPAHTVIVFDYSVSITGGGPMAGTP